MGCKIHRGPRGGRYKMVRKKGGGTKREYLPSKKRKKRGRKKR